MLGFFFPTCNPFFFSIKIWFFTNSKSVNPDFSQGPLYLVGHQPHKMATPHPMESRILTPKVLRVFFIKIASKQPLFKVRQIVQN
jgi:hypothetical protein